MRHTTHPTSTGRQRLTAAVTAALATATLLLTACGGQSDSSGSPTVPSLAPGTTQPGTATDGADTLEAPADPAQATALYMKCMQDSGFSMRVEDAADNTGDAFAAADAECQKHMANAVNDLEIDEEELAKLKDLQIAYAKCMQAAGFDVKATPEGGIMSPIDESSKDGYTDAEATCGADLRAASEGQPSGNEPVQP